MNPVFEGTAGSVTLSQSQQVSGMTFATSGYTLNSGSIAVDGGGTITTNSGVTATINSQITGTLPAAYQVRRRDVDRRRWNDNMRTYSGSSIRERCNWPGKQGHHAATRIGIASGATCNKEQCLIFGVQRIRGDALGGPFDLNGPTVVIPFDGEPPRVLSSESIRALQPYQQLAVRRP